MVSVLRSRVMVTCSVILFVVITVVIHNIKYYCFLKVFDYFRSAFSPVGVFVQANH